MYSLFISTWLGLSAQAEETPKSPKNTMNFVLKTLKKGEASDASGASNSEIQIKLLVNKKLVATYVDFGDASVYRDGNDISVSLRSGISEKIFTATTESQHQIKVSKDMFFMGEDKHIWSKIYRFSKANVWVLHSCTGDCS